MLRLFHGQIMATILPEGKQGFTNSAGDPLSGGKLYTYAAGTSTPKATYADSGAVTPNANPVIMDARGEATIFWDGVYKATLKDAADSLIWTVDNINSTGDSVPLATLASSAGSSLVGFLQAGTGAVSRTAMSKMREKFSVCDFGAVGDGVSDDTPAFQAAINAAIASNNRTVSVISGLEYKITGTLTITQGVMIVADGSQGSTKGWGTTIVHYSNSDLLVWNGNGISAKGTGGGLKNVLILKADGYSGGAAIKILATDDSHRPGEMVIENVLAYGIGTGAWERGLDIDGSACVTPGSKGVRSIFLNKVRFSSVSTNNEYIRINQGVHIVGQYVQLDTGSSGGICGITINGDSDNIIMSGLIINGNMIIGGSSSMNVSLFGRISGLVVSNPLVLGFAGIESSGITSVAKNFRISSNIADSFLGLKTTVTNNATGDNTFYTVTYDNEEYDKNGSFDPNTGVFTCKIAGIYAFTGAIGYNGLGAGHVRQDSYLAHRDGGGTPIGVYGNTCNPYASSSSGGNYTSMLCCQVDMSYGDTMRMQANVSGGAKTVNIYGASVSNGSSFFAGHLMP